MLVSSQVSTYCRVLVYVTGYLHSRYNLCNSWQYPRVEGGITSTVVVQP